MSAAFEKWFKSFTGSEWDDVLLDEAFEAGFKAGFKARRRETTQLKRRMRQARAWLTEPRIPAVSAAVTALDLRRPLKRKR